MEYPQFHYRWEWTLQAEPEALWPFVSDTNRFDRDAGVPPVTRLPQPDAGPLPAGRRRARLVRMGVPVEWEEQPFEWVRPHRFGIVRTYHRGPIGSLRIQADLTPRPEGGTHLVYEVWARPRTAFGLIAIPVQIGLLNARTFAATFRRYDQLAVYNATPLVIPASVSFTAGGRARLIAVRKLLRQQGAPVEVLDRLVDLIEHADDLSVARMRPYALADRWGLPRRVVLETCLWATRAGLLNFQWFLLCPLCRSAMDGYDHLGEISSRVHCDSCHIDFEINFDRSVELTFHPNEAIRWVETREYCIGGPHTTPHIVAQQLLSPNSERTITVALEPGRHRLRIFGLPGGQHLVVAPEGSTEVMLRASSDGWPEGEGLLSPTPSLHLVNATDEERLFILERLAWTDQAVTAAEVGVMQTFRDLFANEALRPGERISVGSMTILFTDLRGSTRLYREIGDAPAFGRVMDHFDTLRAAIAAEEGALVKTIGDAIMAVFRRPAAAMRAMLRAQQALAMPDDGSIPLMLKAGIHAGPCIAVTLNDRLDYFGSTVNIAARLEGLSSGSDLIISEAIRMDPEVAEMLDEPDGLLMAERFETILKGFDQERFALWRVQYRGPDCE